MCRMVLNASPKFHPVHLRIPEDLSRIFHTEKIEQQICPEIAARSNHSFRERGKFPCPPDGLIQLRHRVGAGVEVKRRAACCAEETISHAQRVPQMKPALA